MFVKKIVPLPFLSFSFLKEEVDEIVADLNRSTDGASSPQKEQLSEDWSTLSSPSKVPTCMPA